MITDEQTLSICGPVYVHQPVPSFHNQVTRLARRCGPKLDRSLVGTDSDEGPLLTVWGQAPKTLGIDLRGTRTFAAPHIKQESLPDISF